MRKILVGLAALLGLTAMTAGLALAAWVLPDVGPKADVAAVRAAHPTCHVAGVHVVGDYALLQWYCLPEGTGPAAYKRISGERWKLLLDGGGATSLGGLVNGGVPASIARQLCSGWPKGYSPC